MSAPTIEFPIINLKKVSHVGSMDINQKSDNSGYEGGQGISVSTCPQEWIKLAKLGGDIFKVSNKKSKFVDFHALKENQNDIDKLLKFAEKSGWITPTTIYKYSFYDGDMDIDMEIDFSSIEEAKEEVEMNGEEFDDVITLVDGFAASDVLCNAVNLTSIAPAMVIDMVSTLFVEKYTDCDGVWWNDDFSLETMSLPRGLIFSSKLDNWKIVNTSKMKSKKKNVSPS